MEKKPSIKSFRDLEVYQNAYACSLEVITEVVPRLPKEEKYDLADHLRRSGKAVPRLIAEGYAKKHQKRGFQKYLDDALAESNEMMVCLSHVLDLYSGHVDRDLTERLLDSYDKASRQIYKLRKAWDSFQD